MRDGGMNPRLLLVEDDPVSRAYLAEAARGLPAMVDEAASVAEALASSISNQYDAWLIDAHLPDGSGIVLLACLRERTPRPWPYALAHTASRLPEEFAALRASGFDAAIAKPLPIAEWQAAIRCGLVMNDAIASWDDAAALRALNGSAESMATLRVLFRDELPKQHKAVTAALDAGDVEAALVELHRLKASCGFVGASRLRQAVEALHAMPGSASARVDFEAAIRNCLA